jgi:hypothetical protein
MDAEDQIPDDLPEPVENYAEIVANIASILMRMESLYLTSATGKKFLVGLENFTRKLYHKAVQESYFDEVWQRLYEASTILGEILGTTRHYPDQHCDPHFFAGIDAVGRALAYVAMQLEPPS